MIRIELPYHLRHLAGVPGEVSLTIQGSITTASILDALEQRYPVLRGTIREYGNKRRRPFLRFFACGQDISHIDSSSLLPEQIADGTEPFTIVGAIAGG